MSNPAMTARTKLALGMVIALGGPVTCIPTLLAEQLPPKTQIALMEQALPQSANQGEMRAIASNLNAQRSEYYRKGDLNGLTSLYTPDANFIQLAPVYHAWQGRDQIRQHMQELKDAKASDLVLTVTSADMVAPDKMRVGGDYYVVTQGGQKAYGHFTQVLRIDGGTWKIASHTFARPEPITAAEVGACGLGCKTGFRGYH
jgi:uncharacterized protein (TIGR02246 family)